MGECVSLSVCGLASLLRCVCLQHTGRSCSVKASADGSQMDDLDDTIIEGEEVVMRVAGETDDKINLETDMNNFLAKYFISQK